MLTARRLERLCWLAAAGLALALVLESAPASRPADHSLAPAAVSPAGQLTIDQQIPTPRIVVEPLGKVAVTLSGTTRRRRR